MDARIELLVDHPDALAPLTTWFETEWASYYGPEGPGHAAHDLADCCNRTALPVGLVAYQGTALCGTCALKLSPAMSDPQWSPWLAALLVAPSYRGRGVARALVAATEDLARSLGFDGLYAATNTADALFRQCGWTFTAQGSSTATGLSIYYKGLHPPGGTTSKP